MGLLENFNSAESQDKFPISKSESGDSSGGKSRKSGSRKSSESDSKARGPRKQSEGDKSSGGRGPRKQSEGEKGKNKAKSNGTNSSDTDSQQSNNGPRVNPTVP